MLTPFRIELTDAQLDDLARRLRHARLARPAILDGGETEQTVSRIEELIAYWRDGYDWRAQERRLNGYPQFTAVVDGIRLHLLHAPGTGPAPLPLLLTNGWPSSFVEYLEVLGPLTDPAAHGGDPADAFTVVSPALPGYGFTDRCLDRRVDRIAIAALFDRLMTEVLGYRAYVAHGDDIGGTVVNRLGMNHPRHVLAIQSANWFEPYHGTGTPALTDEERAYLDADQQWEYADGAYAHIQATRPQTLAYALNDSPAGLAAWILEKHLTWSDPATRGRLGADDLLTNVMIYWATETIGSSIRLYAGRRPPVGADDVVRVPASVLIPHEPRLAVPPQSWILRGYPQLTRYIRVPEGGHFLAAEAPTRFVDEVRAAFRPYRHTAPR